LAGEEGAERDEANADYADVDFDYRPEARVHIVYGEGLVMIGKNVRRKAEVLTSCV
jgi:hypothetical protein